MGDVIVRECDKVFPGGDHFRCMVKKTATAKVKRAVAARVHGCKPSNVVFSGARMYRAGNPAKPGYYWQGFFCLSNKQMKAAPPEGKMEIGAGDTFGTATQAPDLVSWIRCGLSKREIKRAICWARTHGWDRWKTCDVAKIKLLSQWPARPHPLMTCHHIWRYTGIIRKRSAKNDIETTKIHFADNKYFLSVTAKKLLDGLVQTLKKHRGMRVEIGGHASKEGVGGANQTLSNRRAVAVYKYLIGKGVRRDRLTVKGYGISNDTGRGHDANRRVEFKVVK